MTRQSRRRSWGGGGLEGRRWRKTRRRRRRWGQRKRLRQRTPALPRPPLPVQAGARRTPPPFPIAACVARKRKMGKINVTLGYNVSGNIVVRFCKSFLTPPPPQGRRKNEKENKKGCPLLRCFPPIGPRKGVKTKGEEGGGRTRERRDREREREGAENKHTDLTKGTEWEWEKGEGKCNHCFFFNIYICLFFFVLFSID